jgi:hypothetical protein
VQPSPAGRSPAKFQLFYLPIVGGWLGQYRDLGDLGDHRSISLAWPSQHAPWPRQVQRTAEQRSNWKEGGRTCILRTYASCLCNKACPTSMHDQSESSGRTRVIRRTSTENEATLQLCPNRQPCSGVFTVICVTLASLEVRWWFWGRNSGIVGQRAGQVVDSGVGV